MAQCGACLVVDNPEDSIRTNIAVNPTTRPRPTDVVSESTEKWHFDRAIRNMAPLPRKPQPIERQQPPAENSVAPSSAHIFFSRGSGDGTTPNNRTMFTQQQSTNPYKLPLCACHGKPINPALLNLPIGPSGSQEFKGFAPNSIPVSLMDNNNSAKRFTPINRPSERLRLKTDFKSKSVGDGLFGRVAKYCRLKRFADPTPPLESQIQAAGDPNCIKFTKERFSFRFGHEGKGSSSEISTVSSMSSVRYTQKNKQHPDSNKLASHMCAMTLENSGRTQEAISIEYHPVLHINSLNNAAPPDEMIHKHSTPPLPTPKEDSSPQAVVRRPFGSQHFLHFATMATPTRGASLPRAANRDAPPEMKPFHGGSRVRNPIMQSQIGRFDDSDQDVFCGRKMIKRRFHLLESANLEDILSDTDDRRIKAICNKFNCEMEAFAKTPRKGCLQNTIVISAACREDIIKCARCLDARLSWSISAQLK